GQRGYTESIAPESRPLVLFVILACIAVGRLTRLTGSRSTSIKGALARDRGSAAYSPALVFTLTSYVLWLVTSGNGRYGMPLLLFVGPMIPASMLMLTASRRVLVYALGGALLVQSAIVEAVGPIRWMPTQWKATWFDVDVPERLRERPYLYLSLN